MERQVRAVATLTWMVSQLDREQLELAFWRESDSEKPGADSLDTLTNKMSEGRILLEKFHLYRELFSAATAVVELGGGQGWSSCMMKRAFPHARVMASDISPEAMYSLAEWERVFKTHLDGAFACRSYDVPVRDSSVDLVVVFAAAHHFGRHRSTLAEIHRMLRPGGRAIYLHEPASREYSYKWMVEHMNKMRPVVREDVLRISRIKQLATECGLRTDVRYVPSTTYRGPIETMYFYMLGHLPSLQRVLPCSIDVLFERPL